MVGAVGFDGLCDQVALAVICGTVVGRKGVDCQENGQVDFGLFDCLELCLLVNTRGNPSDRNYQSSPQGHSGYSQRHKGGCAVRDR
jgi:hypothetical protein